MYTAPYFKKTATIAQSQTNSDAIDLGWGLPLKLYIPAAFTGTTIKFSVTYDGTNWSTLYVDGADYSVSVSTSKAVYLDQVKFMGVKEMKLISGSSEAAARSIVVIYTRPL